MNQDRQLTAFSLLAILLMTLHITDDIARGISPPGADNVGASVIFLVWLVGTLLIGAHPAGVVIQFVGGLFAAAMPVLHMGGRRYPEIAAGEGGFFFVWTLILCGAVGGYTMILAARALWRRWRRLRSADQVLDH